MKSAILETEIYEIPQSSNLFFGPCTFYVLILEGTKSEYHPQNPLSSNNPPASHNLKSTQIVCFVRSTEIDPPKLSWKERNFMSIAKKLHEISDFSKLSEKAA